VDGDIVSPRVAIAEGAHFRGSVDMQKKAVPASAPASSSSSVKPAPQPAVAQAAQPAAH
jgi:cytoskeletal protein CcmA (bactofilin family)